MPSSYHRVEFITAQLPGFADATTAAEIAHLTNALLNDYANSGYPLDVLTSATAVEDMLRSSHRQELLAHLTEILRATKEGSRSLLRVLLQTPQSLDYKLVVPLDEVHAVLTVTPQ